MTISKFGFAAKAYYKWASYNMLNNSLTLSSEEFHNKIIEVCDKYGITDFEFHAYYDLMVTRRFNKVYP